MKISTLTALVVTAILCEGGYGLPARRQSEENVEHTVSDLLDSALKTYLNSKGAKDFRSLPGGRQVNWVGENSDVSPEFGNAIIFNTVDIVQDRTADVGETHFADAYKNFVIAVNEALNLNGSTSIEDQKDLEDLAKEVVAKCNEAEELATTKRQDFRAKARSRRPDGPDPDPKELDQALQSDPEWTTANAECVQANNKLGAVKSDTYGPNFALFSLAYKNVQPFVDATSQVVEGVTMAVDQAANGSSILNGDSKIGNVVPSYQLPSLQKTLEGWQQRADDEAPEFSWDSTKETVESSQTSTEGHSSVNVNFGSFGGGTSASHSESDSLSTSKAQNFKVQFGAIDLIDVEPGLWFDRYRMAQAAQNTQDEKEQPVTEVFTKHFGTKEEPLAAAQFNEKALVAYQISWSLQFSNEEEAKKFRETSVDAHANVLWFEGSGGGKTMSDYTSLNKDGTTVEYKPKNKNGVILGYTVHKYFGN